MKRLFDILLGSVLLLIAFVPMLLIAILIKITSHGTVIFWSERIGRFSHKFQMPKFRTMRTDTPLVPSNKIDSPREYITPVGRLLRKSSLDELPQLYSVIIGDMSLVGPRPVLEAETEVVSKRKNANVDCLRPGITGWAQINGRDELDNKQKIALDVEYVEKASMTFDIYILWKTLFYVIRSSNIQH